MLGRAESSYFNVRSAGRLAKRPVEGAENLRRRAAGAAEGPVPVLGQADSVAEAVSG